MEEAAATPIQIGLVVVEVDPPEEKKQSAPLCRPSGRGRG